MKIQRFSAGTCDEEVTDSLAERHIAVARGLETRMRLGCSRFIGVVSKKINSSWSFWMFDNLEGKRSDNLKGEGGLGHASGAGGVTL